MVQRDICASDSNSCILTYVIQMTVLVYTAHMRMLRKHMQNILFRNQQLIHEVLQDSPDSSGVASATFAHPVASVGMQDVPSAS